MAGSFDGWMADWIDGCLDGWMDGWMDGWVDDAFMDGDGKQRKSCTYQLQLLVFRVCQSKLCTQVLRNFQIRVPQMPFPDLRRLIAMLLQNLAP